MRGVILALVLSAVVVAPALDADRPNILFIMSDDHAAHAIGAYGSRVNQTPHLDRLAREGALLTNVFATNSICTPSRAAILTGQYSHVNGVTMFNRFDSSRMTVARLLQAGGYNTGMIGKWHLGSDPVGFDRWEILPGQGAYVNPIFYTGADQKMYTGALEVGRRPKLEIAPRSRPERPHRAHRTRDDLHRKIIERLAQQSAAFGTSIVYENGVGVWRPVSTTTSTAPR